MSNIQAVAIMSKIVVIADCILEVVMYVYEYCRLHNLKKQAIAVLVYYNEYERRHFFGKRYSCRTGTWMMLLLIGFALVLTLVDRVECNPGQAT